MSDARCHAVGGRVAASNVLCATSSRSDVRHMSVPEENVLRNSASYEVAVTDTMGSVSRFPVAA